MALRFGLPTSGAGARGAHLEIADGCQGDERADCPILSKLSGNAAPSTLTFTPKATPKVARKAERAETPKADRSDATGLAAWMLSLNRVADTQHA